jgi:hypothetical protein
MKTGHVRVRRDADLDGGASLHTFRGGMRYGSTGIANWTHPLVTLAVYPAGVELRSTFRWLQVLVPVWRARYEELSVVQSVGRADPDGSDSARAPVQARGVRFVARDGSYVIFWCFNRTEVLEALDRQRVAVETEPKRFQFFHPEP